MPKRKVKIGETRVAGYGKDGGLFGVTTITSKNGGEGDFRKQVCATCPWRKDAVKGAFPAQAYRESAGTCYDAAFSMFSCHESGAETPQTCAGFLLANSGNNILVRLAEASGRLDRSKMKPTVPLYKSYRHMAIANGVDPDDPAILPCRGDNEAMHLHVARLRKLAEK